MTERIERQPGMTDAEYGDFSDAAGGIYVEGSREQARRRARDLDRQNRRARNATARPHLDDWRGAKLHEMTDSEQREWLALGARLIEASWLTGRDRARRDTVRERRSAARRYSEVQGRRRFPPEWKKPRCEACGSRDQLRRDYLLGNKSDNSWWNHLTICRSCQKEKSAMQRDFGEYGGLIQWAEDLELHAKRTWTACWWKARTSYYERRQ